MWPQRERMAHSFAFQKLSGISFRRRKAAATWEAQTS